MIVGYARVSTEAQRLDLQIQALKASGCNRIFEDLGQSGRNFHRDGLTSALESLKPGGMLVVWRLDRLGRSLVAVVQIVEQLEERGIGFRSMMENIDTTSAGGRLMLHMMAALAEFERSVISERTRAGLSAAKARGKCLGRPKALTEEEASRALAEIGGEMVRLPEVSTALNVSTRTLRRHLRSCGGVNKTERS